MFFKRFLSVILIVVAYVTHINCEKFEPRSSSHFITRLDMIVGDKNKPE